MRLEGLGTARRKLAFPSKEVGIASKCCGLGSQARAALQLSPDRTRAHPPRPHTRLDLGKSFLRYPRAFC